MKNLAFLQSTKALILDIDGTIYQRNEAYLAAGTRGEIAGVAKILGVSFAVASASIKKTRKMLAGETPDNQATMTETVYRLGITPEQWSALRLKAWRPEEWIEEDAEMSTLITNLARSRLVAFGTNSPVEVGRKIVRLVGIKTDVIPDIRVFGPENLGVSKPNPKFFSEIAKAILVPVGQCVSIGDREFSDGPPAIEAGYAGAIIVP